jgi:vacuolar protein sorting-associated protein 13A/C
MIQQRADCSRSFDDAHSPLVQPQSSPPSHINSQVDNLNTSQLNLGVWSGDIKLRNLRLKKDALDKLNLPIDVTEGYLGELTIKIAW